MDSTTPTRQQETEYNASLLLQMTVFLGRSRKVTTVYRLGASHGVSTIDVNIQSVNADRSSAPENPQVWAPDVTPGPDGIYWMYFSAIASSTGDAAKHCIGFATADNPKGPFTPTSDEPWVCDEDTGDIDPDQFLDEDGTRWVVWKVDGNSAGQDTPIMIQQVDGDDGNSKIGDATEILNRDDADGPLVEVGIDTSASNNDRTDRECRRPHW